MTTQQWLQRIVRWATVSVLALAVVAPVRVGTASGPAEPEALTPRARLPLIMASPTCPPTSGNSYGQGIMYQVDPDNPVRPAWNHADKNLDLRGYSVVNGPAKALIDVGRDPGENFQPPQLKTLFSPARVPAITNTYRVNNWNWAASPSPGTRGSPITDPTVTLIGLATTPGEVLRSPIHGRDLGPPAGQGGAMVIFADSNSITIHYTREDTAANGYTVHVDNICTDPNLLALYNALDSGGRYQYPSGGYNLPGLSANQVFGRARSNVIYVAIVDTGAFLDPRSCKEFWFWEVPAGGPCP
jgi:hypothetical protein